MCLLLLVLLPAVVNPAGVVAFEPLKVSVLRVCASVVALGWLVYRLLGGTRVDVGAQPIVRAGLAFVGVLAVSTVTSIQPGLSLFGSFDRGMGLLTLASGAVLLVVGTHLWGTEPRRERVVSALLLGAIVPCAYALLQRLGRDPIPWSTLGAPGSTFGSPTFLGGYLVMVAPFGLYRVVSGARGVSSGGWRNSLSYAGWLALLLMIGAVLVQTTIRGPLLGLAAGTLTFALLLGRRGRVALLGAVGFIAVTLLLAVSATRGAGVESLGRFLRIAGAGDSSSERLVVWRDALGLPLPEPLRAVVGFGLETQAAALERAEATVRLTQNQQWDRVHNLVLDTWVTAGVLGVLALLVLLGVAVVSVWRAWRASDGRQSLFAAAVLAALVGHLVEVSFAFHTVVTGTFLWVVLGLGASLKSRPGVDSAPRRRLVALAALVWVLLLPALAAPAIADGVYGAGRRAAQAGDTRAAAALDEAASQWAPWVEEPMRAAGLAWQQVATRQGDADAAARAEADLQEAARRAPWEPTPQLRLARLYLARAELDASETACQAALAVGPYRATVWDTCADVSGRRGLPDQARERRARAEELRK